MESLPNNLTPTQAACLLALRTQLHNLEKTIASLFQIAMAQPEGPLREQRLMDEVSEPAFESANNS